MSIEGKFIAPFLHITVGMVGVQNLHNRGRGDDRISPTLLGEGSKTSSSALFYQNKHGYAISSGHI